MPNPNDHKTKEYNKVSPSQSHQTPQRPASQTPSSQGSSYYASTPSYGQGSTPIPHAPTPSRTTYNGGSYNTQSSRPSVPSPQTSRPQGGSSYGSQQSSSYVRGQAKILPPSATQQPMRPSEQSHFQGGSQSSYQTPSSHQSGAQTSHSTSSHTQVQSPRYQGGSSHSYASARQTPPPRTPSPTLMGTTSMIAHGTAGMARSAANVTAHSTNGSGQSSSRDTQQLQQSIPRAAQGIRNAQRATHAAAAVAVGIAHTPQAISHGAQATVKAAQMTCKGARYVANSATGKVVGHAMSAVYNSKVGAPVRVPINAAGKAVNVTKTAVNTKIIKPVSKAAATAKKRTGAAVRGASDKAVARALSKKTGRAVSTKEARNAINKAKGKTVQKIVHGKKAVVKGATVAGKGAKIVGGSVKRGVHTATAPIRGASKVANTAMKPIAGMSKVVTADNTAKAMADASLAIATKVGTAPATMAKAAEKRNKANIKKLEGKKAKFDRKGNRLDKKKAKLDKKRKDAIKNRDKKAASKLSKKYEKFNKKSAKFAKKKAKNAKKLARRQKWNKAMNWIAHPFKNLAKLGIKLALKAGLAIAKALLSNPYVLGGIVAAFLIFILINLMSSVIAGGAGAGGAVASKFVSSIMEAAEHTLDLSWTPEGRVLAALQDMNWAQYIADRTCAELGDSFVASAKRDAQNHYASSGSKIRTVREEGGTKVTPFNWYADVAKGEVGHVWMREQCDKVTKKDGTVDMSNTNTSATGYLYTNGGWLMTHSNQKYHYEPYDYVALAADPEMYGSFSRINISPNANIVPIVSMAHDRYNDEWNWENYEIPMAYVYYMYALSHNTAHYDPVYDASEKLSDISTYSYNFRDSHEDSTLFSFPAGQDWESRWNGTSLTRPAAVLRTALTNRDGTPMLDDSGNQVYGPGYNYSGCSNIYVHDYKFESLFGDGLQAVGQELLNAGREVLGFVGGIFGIENSADAIPLPSGTRRATYTRSFDPDDAITVSKVSVNGTETTDFSAALSGAFNESVLQPNGTTVTKGCGNYICLQYDSTAQCGKTAHTHGTGSCNTSACAHTCGEGCCSKTHPHEGESCDTNSCSHTCGASCCSIQAHTHKDWTDFSSPGCYDTIIICKGHCGGHITPTVNLAVTYTFEGLAYQDAVSMDASFMSALDFVFPDSYKSVAKWSDEVTKKASKWFRPLPNGPVSAIAWFGSAYFETRLSVLQWWQDTVHAWFGDDEDTSYDVDTTYHSTSASGSEEDEMGFEGWFDPDDTTKTYLDESLMDELYKLYGDPSTFYEEGIEMWRNFDVVFNVGLGQSLSPEMKDSIVGQINEQYPGLCGERIDVIQDALDHVGWYNYVCNTEAHMNGMYSEMGPSECTGFVSGVYMRALGSKCGYWSGVSNTFTSKTGETGPNSGIWGTTGVTYYTTAGSGQVAMSPHGGISNVKPGDAVGATPDSLGSAHGHAMIYLGYMNFQVEGDPYGSWGWGHYVVDCNGGGGSMFRKVTITPYTNYYNPFAAAGCE